MFDEEPKNVFSNGDELDCPKCGCYAWVLMPSEKNIVIYKCSICGYEFGFTITSEIKSS